VNAVLSLAETSNLTRAGEQRAKPSPQRPPTAIVLKGTWRCRPERATRADLRKFLGAGLRTLRDIAEEQKLEPEDKRTLFEVAFTALTRAEELIWAHVENDRRAEREGGAADRIDLSEKEARVLREIGEEQEADLTAFREAVWCEDVHRPEGEVSTDLENYSL